MTFIPKCEFWVLCSPLEVTNAFFSPACHVYNLFPPLVHIKLGQQLFTGEAAGGKPMRRFMQIECARPFDESFPPVRKFELVDLQWWCMWPYPNAWLQDEVITLLLVYAACPLSTCKHSVCMYTKAMSIFSRPQRNLRGVCFCSLICQQEVDAQVFQISHLKPDVLKLLSTLVHWRLFTSNCLILAHMQLLFMH